MTGVVAVESLERFPRDYFITITFPQSRSRSYLAAITAAQCADGYREIQYGKRLQHYAAFGRTAAQVLAAYSLHSQIWNLRHVRYFVAGKRLETVSNVHQVLHCYRQALLCTDPHAHCHSVTAGVFDNDPDRRCIFPCALLRMYGPTLSTEHSASLPDQVQAQAVRVGCDWCPAFDASQLRDASPTDLSGVGTSGLVSFSSSPKNI